MERMTYSMDTSQLMNKVALVAGIEIMHELRKTNFHSPRATWPWLLTAECSPLIAAKANSESPIRHHSLGWSVSFLVTGWLHCTASIMEVSAFLFYWNTYPGYDFLSLNAKHLLKLPFMNLHASSTVMVFHTILLLI